MASEIRVNKITHTAGVGTVTPNTHGIVVAGIVTANSFSGINSVTATSFHGSGANLTGINTAFGNSSINSTGIITAAQFHGDGSNLTGLPASSEWSFGSTGITTTKNLGINTSTVDNYETVGAANSFRGIYIGDGSLIFNARLDNPNGYYIGTGRNALNAGPITLGSTMTLDGAWVIV